MLKKDKKWILNVFDFEKPFPIVFIRAIGRHSISDKSYYWDSSTRKDKNFCLFQYTLNGQGEIKIGNKTYSQRKDEAFFITIPGNHAYYLPQNSNFWEVLYIEFSIEADEFVKNLTNLNNNSIYKLQKNSKLLNLIWEFYYASVNNEITDIYKCSQYAYNILFEFSSLFVTKKEKSSELIKEIKKYIKKNYQKPISSEDISRYVNVSKSHLTRKFKAETNISPGQYLIQTRLTKARELLLDTDSSIEKISDYVGFSCANYFSKAFRHKFKISPTEYRNYYKNYYKVNFVTEK